MVNMECPECSESLHIGPAVGRYCPNPTCEVKDDWHNYVECPTCEIRAMEGDETLLCPKCNATFGESWT